MATDLTTFKCYECGKDFADTTVSLSNSHLNYFFQNAHIVAAFIPVLLMNRIFYCPTTGNAGRRWMKEREYWNRRI